MTKLSLKIKEEPDTTPKGTTSCKFWGLGSDGTVGANKNSIKIIGDHTDMYAQGYFSYDSKKSGGVTVSHLRFGKKPIKSTYSDQQGRLCGLPQPLLCRQVRHGRGSEAGRHLPAQLLVGCGRSSTQHLPGQDEEISSPRTTLNSTPSTRIHIAKELGLGGRTNTILQAAFFKLAKIIPTDEAVKFMKDAATKLLRQEGRKDRRDEPRRHRPRHRRLQEGQGARRSGPSAEDKACCNCDAEDTVRSSDSIVKNILSPVNAQQRRSSCRFPPLSACADGTVPLGSSAL